MKRKKICFICSSGGHFSEISNLIPLTNEYSSFLITEKNASFKSDFCKKHQYFLSEINRREKIWLIKFFFIFIKCFFIFIKERPTHLITTGALCSYPMALICKFFRRKLIYIESFARISDLSKTGKFMYNKADLFLVQWEVLTENYPKAKYVGSFYGESL